MVHMHKHFGLHSGVCPVCSLQVLGPPLDLVDGPIHRRLDSWQALQKVLAAQGAAGRTDPQKCSPSLEVEVKPDSAKVLPQNVWNHREVF